MKSGSGLGALTVAAAALALGLSACSTTPPPVSVHNLERPSDMAFACVGLLVPTTPDGGTNNADGGAGADAGSTPVVSGRPMSACNKPGVFDPPFDVSRRNFAFIANSARGELSVLDLDNSKLIDLDLANPETNVAPLGVQPEQISASNDGCRIVSANRGSCDLTLVDVSTLMTPELAIEGKVTVPTTARSTFSQEIVVRGGTTGKPLRLNPQEIMFLPQDTSAISPATAPMQNLCALDRPFADPIGWNPTPTQPVETQWKALVTYPTCNLVALVDLPSGNIVDSMKVNVGSDGVSIALAPAGSDPDCPVEDFCDGRSAPPVAAPDGGADASGDGGADGGSGTGSAATAVSSDPFVNPNGTSPSSLAILPTGERAYVGLAQASFVAAIDVQPNHLAVPSTGGSIKLHEGALGVDGVRLSIDPYKAGSTPGQLGGFVGEVDQHVREYLYVVARDGTVRVVDVSPRTRLLPETECDVNVDPRFVPVSSPDPLLTADRTNVCWPTEPPDLAHRQPLALGPGIRLPSIPRDVAFADLKTYPSPNHEEIVLDGAYAFILTSSGAVYEANIFPTLRTQTLVNAVAVPAPLPEVQPLVNSLRDQNMITFTSSLDPTVGPARVDLAPTIAPQGPQIESINTTSPDDNATNIVPGSTIPTYVFFPQQICTRSTPASTNRCDSSLAMIQPQRQTWSVVWEGNTFGPSFSGQFAVSKSGVTTLTDASVDFCQAGALPGDFVTIFGCTVNSQCGPLQVCERSATAPETAGTLPINGLCVPNDSTLQTKRATQCAALLDSVRRYEIVAAKSPPGQPSVLTLRPKLDEIVTQSLAQTLPQVVRSPPLQTGCKKLNDSCAPPTDPTRSGFLCLHIDDPISLRCVQPCGCTAADPPTCNPDSKCRSGQSCVQFPNPDADPNAMPPIPPTQGLCAEGPTLTQDLIGNCQLDQLTAYDVGAGSSFLVHGTAATPYVPGLVDPTTFSCVPNPDRLDRIPYFQTVSGVRTAIQNCPAIAYTMTDGAGNIVYPDLQGQLLDNVHQTPTPNPCLIQLGPNIVDPPLLALFQNREIRFVLGSFNSYLGDSETISFDVHGGFLPDQVVLPTTIDINTPNRIVLGPVDSQTQAADTSQPTFELPYLFVIDQRRLGSAAAGVGATRGQVLRINPRRATTSDTNSLVPIYDDPVSTNNLWPIQ